VTVDPVGNHEGRVEADAELPMSPVPSFASASRLMNARVPDLAMVPSCRSTPGDPCRCRIGDRQRTGPLRRD